MKIAFWTVALLALVFIALSDIHLGYYWLSVLDFIFVLVAAGILVASLEEHIS